MPIYQITSILRAASAQPEVHDLLRKLTQIVLERDGVLAAVNSWGLQQLAYRMRAHQEYHTHGRYVQFKVIASPVTLKELERNMRLDRRVLRHMTIKERNTSVASFMDLEPDELAAAAHKLSRELLQTPNVTESTGQFGREGRPASYGGQRSGSSEFSGR